MSMFEVRANASVYGDELVSPCRIYGANFESFTLTEKANILAAIGLWTEHCDDREKTCSLAEYMAEYCPVRDDTDAHDMLMELNYRKPQDAMPLIAAVSAQIFQGLWLGA